MKKRGWTLFVAAAAYSYIFYRQNAGVNFLLFSILVVTLLAWSRTAVLKQRSWILVAAMSILSGIFVFVYSSWLALLANLVSLLAVAGATWNPGSSVVINLFSSGGSILASPAFLAEDIYNQTQQPRSEEKNYMKGLFVWVVPIILAVLFFAIYRAANPLFAEFTRAINLDFVTFRWIMFTLGGLLVCSGLVRARRFQNVDKWESGHVLTSEKTTQPVWDEKKAAIILFVLLNAMLLFMNLLDVNYLYLGKGLPEGITHKQFVHNGVGNLMLSIVLGISVILYFFRGALNFGENKYLRALVYAWIAQNLFMVISTSIRNEIYISEALITYKRIGVYFWLTIAAAGLATAAYKIHKRLHAWFLVRSNGLIALVMLVASASVDWDRFVTDFNLARIGHIKDLDKRYLISLSETNLLQLYNIAGKRGFENNIYYHYEADESYRNIDQLDLKLACYLQKIHGTDWRSVNLRQLRVLNDIRELDNEEKIRTLNLSQLENPALDAYRVLTNIRKIVLPEGFQMNDMAAGQVSEFRNLDTLEIPTLQYTDLPSFVKLRHLKTVRIGTLDKTALAFLRHKMPGTAITVDQFIYQKDNKASASR